MINAVTVIPLITLLISWPVFAVTVTKSSYSNLPTLGPSATHLSRKKMFGKTNLLKKSGFFGFETNFLKLDPSFRITLPARPQPVVFLSNLLQLIIERSENLQRTHFQSQRTLREPIFSRREPSENFQRTFREPFTKEIFTF